MATVIVYCYCLCLCPAIKVSKVSENEVNEVNEVNGNLVNFCGRSGDLVKRKHKQAISLILAINVFY